ncbi:unnamed protein product [Closterium sp. Naga37s-1]|nr:unnamed protein product [Closterium sp. Naga37s-1]
MPRSSRASRAPSLVTLAVALVLVAGGAIRGGECMLRTMRLVTLSNNALGARCLDGSDPSYFFRPGASSTPPVKRTSPRAADSPVAGGHVAGSGQSVNRRWFASKSSGISAGKPNQWGSSSPAGGAAGRDTWQPAQTPGGDPAIRIHIHLPAGGWCFNAQECLNRSLTFLGSSSGWPTIIPESVPMGGILNDDPVVNPLFADWPLARINYCDGGGFAGQRGRINVTVPGAPVRGRQAGGQGGKQGRLLAGMKPGPGGSGGAAGGGGAVGGGGSGGTGGAIGGKPGGSVGGKQRIVPLYMDGWNVVRSIIDGAFFWE